MKERFQNPAIGDEIRLRLFTYNSNNRASLDSVEKVEIYVLDKASISADNPDGRILLDTITSVTEEETGLYYVDLQTEQGTHVIGNYIDAWYVTVNDEWGVIENGFQIYPAMWFTTPTPIIYDFEFAFRPNRLRVGEKRYLAIEIKPNVPSRSELYKYYENLAIVAPLRIYIEQKCGDCVPEEEDLRMVVDGATVELRERCIGNYFIDTSDMEPGVYNVWFEMVLGESVYISEKNFLQIAK